MSEEYKIDLCKHAIGMGYRKPYRRHGRVFYRPYRNYFATSGEGIAHAHWKSLEDDGYAKSQKTENGRFIFWMTRSGLDWLGEKIGMHIYDEED